jgi:hypothetical protein
MKFRGQRPDFLHLAIGRVTGALLVGDIAFLTESICLSDQLAVATQGKLEGLNCAKVVGFSGNTVDHRDVQPIPN